MQRSGGGSIVNLGSVSWMRSTPGMVACTAAKAAIQGLTRTLARELGASNIRVNSILPGAIDTPRQRQWHNPDREREFLEGQCLKLRLIGEDLARAALFLASDDARGISRPWSGRRCGARAYERGIITFAAVAAPPRSASPSPVRR